jgi:coenzyme F420-reducing hydrogenase delta subunit
MARSLIDLLGIEPQRLHLEWISAAEGARFAQLVKDFTEQVRELGANPLRKEYQESMAEGATVS